VTLLLFNSRSRSKQRFTPLTPGHARVYSCGPTVYSPQHVGNLRSCVFADLLKRALLLEGLRVTHVINITDVGHLSDDADAGDDKMERAARESGRRASEIAAEFSAQWSRDRRALNCLEPEVLCRATEHIPEQIEMIRRIEARGAATALPTEFTSTLRSFRATPSWRGFRWTRSAAARVCKMPCPASAIRQILRCGSLPSPACIGSRNGIRIGGADFPAGTLSARR